MNSNPVVERNYQKSKITLNSSWRKIILWLLCQKISKEKLAKNTTPLQEFQITSISTKEPVKPMFL